MTRSRSQITTEQWNKVDENTRKKHTEPAAIGCRTRKIIREYDRAVELLEALGIGYEKVSDLEFRARGLAREQHEAAKQHEAAS